MRATYGRADCKAAASLLDLDASHPVMHTYPYIFWNCGTWEALKHLKDLDIIVSPKQCAPTSIDRCEVIVCGCAVSMSEAASGAGEPPQHARNFFPRELCWRATVRAPAIPKSITKRIDESARAHVPKRRGRTAPYGITMTVATPSARNPALYSPSCQTGATSPIPALSCYSVVTTCVAACKAASRVGSWRCNE